MSPGFLKKSGFIRTAFSKKFKNAERPNSAGICMCAKTAEAFTC